VIVKGAKAAETVRYAAKSATTNTSAGGNCSLGVGEPLFEFLRASDGPPIACELRFHGETYGVAPQFYLRGELWIAHKGFVTRALAVQWAEQKRHAWEGDTPVSGSCPPAVKRRNAHHLPSSPVVTCAPGSSATTTKGSGSWPRADQAHLVGQSVQIEYRWLHELLNRSCNVGA